MGCRHVHRATKHDDANTTCRRFDPNADVVNLQRRLEIDWQFTTAETFNLLLIDCNAALSDPDLDFFAGVTPTAGGAGAPSQRNPGPATPPDAASPWETAARPAVARPSRRLPSLWAGGDHLRRPHVAPGLPPMTPRGSRALRCGQRRSSHDPPGRSHRSRNAPAEQSRFVRFSAPLK